MTTKTMTTTAAADIASSAPRRRAGRPRKTQAPPEPPAPKRGRRPRLSGDALVTSLAEMVDLLIKENRQLKRALACRKSAGERESGAGRQGALRTSAAPNQRARQLPEDSASAIDDYCSNQDPDATQGY